MAHDELTRIVSSHLKRTGQLQWQDWLPLAVLAVEAPERWIETFNHLGSEQQYDLINLLRDDQAGLFANVLLLILASYALEVSDEQVRQFILEDAVPANERHERRIQKMKANIVSLTHRVEGASERLKDEFDLTAELARLETELARIRSAENDLDGRYVRVHDIEREIIRTETKKRILSRYNEADRTIYLEGLKSEVESLEQRKTFLEQKISDTIGERDSARREVVALETEFRAISSDIESSSSRQKQLQEGIAEMKNLADNARKEEAKGRQEHARLIAELKQIDVDVEQVEQTNKDIRKKLGSEKSRLQELQEEAKVSGLTDIENKVREIYALLPKDRADKACGGK
ncbi:MAG: hypothetical protein HQL06_11450 [Nitrospirae bacterium]|nr:hypothetical protein [Nitrospirota bacterium]